MLPSGNHWCLLLRGCASNCGVGPSLRLANDLATANSVSLILGFAAELLAASEQALTLSLVHYFAQLCLIERLAFQLRSAGLQKAITCRDIGPTLDAYIQPSEAESLPLLLYI